MAASVKIPITNEIATALERLKRQYPTLDTPELFKLSLAEFDRMLELKRRKAWADSLPIHELTEEEHASLAEAYAELDAGKGRIMTIAELKAEAMSD